MLKSQTQNISPLKNNKQAIYLCERIKKTSADKTEIKRIDKILAVLNKYNEMNLEVAPVFVNKLKLLHHYIGVASPEVLEKRAKVCESLRTDYKGLRNYTQNLPDIVAKINKHNSKHNIKAPIAELLKRGAMYKLKTATAETVKIFYTLFIANAYSFRGKMENDTAFEKEICLLQKQILSLQHIDINEYFKLLLNKESMQAYSVTILLTHFCAHPKAINFVKSQPTFFCVQLHYYLQNTNNNPNNEALYALAYLVLQLETNEFNLFLKDSLIKGGRLPLFGSSFYQQCLYHLAKDQNTAKKIRLFFDCVIENNQIEFLVNLINSTDVEEARNLLRAIYGKVIDTIDKEEKLSHYFNPLFLLYLSKPKYLDYKNRSLVSQLLFYMAMNDNKANNTSNYEANLGLLLATIDSTEMKKISELIELAKILRAFGSVPHRLTSVIRSFDLKDKGHQEFFVTELFMSLNENQRSEMSFILAKSLKLHYLKGKPVVLRVLCKYNRGFAGYLEILKETDQNLPEKLTENLNIPYYLSRSLFKDSQFDKDAEKFIINLVFKLFASSPHKVGELNNYLGKCNELIDSIKRLIDFYQDAEYVVYKIKAFEHMLHGLTSDTSDSFDDRLKHTGHIVTNFINYNIDHLKSIVRQESMEAQQRSDYVFDDMYRDRYGMSLWGHIDLSDLTDDFVHKNLSEAQQEVLDVFDKVLARKPGQTLLQWKGSSNAMGDSLFYIYCHYKYPQSVFDRDFKTLNPLCVYGRTFYDFSRERTNIKKYVKENAPIFQQMGIQYLQHNQVGALALVEYSLKKDTKNLFMKIDTGQGKSLIAAETAKRILDTKKAKQVMIITCYDHLAQRDYQRFKRYYELFNITATYCSKSTKSNTLKEAQVIYTDLQTYFTVLRSDSYDLLQGKAVDIYYPDPHNTALIMDEFDSLILDADEITQKIQYFPVPYIGKLGDVNVQGKLAEILGLDTNFTIMTLPVTNEQGVKKQYKPFENWFNWKIEEQKAAGNKEQNIIQSSLGQTYRYADSFLAELQKNKRAGFVHHYLDPLSFYKQFKLVVGFSGSISKDKIRLFNNYCKGSIEYYEIPPFFGIQQHAKNRQERTEKVIPEEAIYLQAIVDEVNQCKAQQPILIFADSVAKSTLSDFDLIKEKLQKIPEIMRGEYTLIFIKEESEINDCLPSIGREKQITLCTRIMARGVDIKVDKHLKQGLHLILTYYPEHENIYTQMLGRTARQDEPGSYSIIVKKDKKFKPNSEVELSKDAQALHSISQRFFQNISHKKIKMEKNNLKWPLFSDMLWSKQSLLEDDNYKNAVEEHINSLFFASK